MKFSSFEKKEKFYNTKIVLNRFINHLKFVCFKNVSNILSSFLNWGTNEPSTPPKIKKKDDEEAYRKMLLGKKSIK